MVKLDLSNIVDGNCKWKKGTTFLCGEDLFMVILDSEESYSLLNVSQGVCCPNAFKTIEELFEEYKSSDCDILVDCDIHVTRRE